MKINATYACGHDAARDFDGRSLGARSEASGWSLKASGKCCPRCSKAQITEAVNALDADTLRQILLSLTSNRAVVEAIKDATETAV